MPLLTVTQPSPNTQEAMAPTFWACGICNGLDTIKVQFFGWNENTQDMEQVDEKPGNITAGNPISTWSAQFPNETPNPNGPPYVLMVSGWVAADPDNTVITAAPVQFYCVNGGNGSGCGRFQKCEEPRAKKKSKTKTKAKK